MATLLLAVSSTTLLQAQSVRGRLVDSTSGRAVSGALVSLYGTSKTPLSQVVTERDGAFLIAVPTAGPFTLRLAAVGFGRHADVPVQVGAQPIDIGDIRLSRVVISLRDLMAVADKRNCGKSALEGATFARLLDAAQQSMEVVEASVRSHALGFDARIIRRRVLWSNRSDTLADTATTAMNSWPVQSVPFDSIERVGFARPMSPKEGNGWVYYGPDAGVIFSDWFIEGHCFTVKPDTASDSLLQITFSPARNTHKVDISGELVLDRKTLALDRLNFIHRNFPYQNLDDASGGSLDFVHADGVWVPVQWRLWAPVIVTRRALQRPMIRPGVTEITSRAAVLTPEATSPITVTIVGTVESEGRMIRAVGTGN